jgi:TfoX/Sxy family transcriptional regulator of competence genes
MATKQSTVDYLLDQLQAVGNIRARKMFGDYALYASDKVVALICDDELFVKITTPGKEFLGKNYQEGFAYKGAKPSMRISGDLMEDRDFLAELITITSNALPLPKPKKLK